MKKQIGENIKQARLRTGISQIELAHRIGGSSASFISFIETGERNITAERLWKVSKVLNVDITTLFESPIHNIKINHE